MLKTLVKIFISATGVLVACLLAALLWASDYVDSPQFRKDLFTSLSDITGREVRLHGELDVTVYPWLGLRAYDVTVDNEPGFGDEPYLSYREVALGIKVMPLLAQELVVSDILIDGMEVNFARNAQSEVNWDHYEETADASQTPIFSYFKRIFIEGVTVDGATMTFDDGVSQEAIRLHGLSARVGPFTPGEAAGFRVNGVFDRLKTDLSIELHLSGILNTDIFSRSNMFDDTSVELLVRGGVLPGKENLRLVSDLEYDRADDALRLEDMRARVFDIDVNGKIEIDDILSDWRVRGEVKTELFSPRSLIKLLGVQRPLEKVRGLDNAKGGFSFEASEKDMSFTKVDILLDETHFQGVAGVIGYSDPSIEFDLTGTKLDLNRYLPLFETGTPFIWDDFALPFWADLNAAGKLSVQDFKIYDTTFGNVKTELAAHNGKIKAFAKGGVWGGLFDTNLNLDIKSRKNIPTVWASAKGSIASLKFDSTPFAAGDWGAMEGPAKVGYSLLINETECPADARSIDVLRQAHLELDVQSPETRLTLTRTQKACEFDKVHLELKSTPAKRKEHGYQFHVQSSLSLHQSKSENYGTAKWDGPVFLSRDLDSVVSSGGRFDLATTGWLLPELKETQTAKGRASFASNLCKIELGDLEIKALGATLSGTMVAEKPLEKDRVLDGSLSVYGFNPEAVITRFGVEMHEMEDETVFDHFTMHADYKYEDNSLYLSALKAQLDDTAISGTVKTVFQNPPVFTVALKLGRADLDRYLAPDTEPDLAKLRAGIDEDAPPVAMPLDTLKWLNINGSLWVDEFILEDLRVQQLSGIVDARDGVINISNLSGDFYGGSLKGTLHGIIHADELEVAVGLSLRQFQAGPMLTDLVEKEYVRGATNMEINLSGKGATDDDIVANLNGSIDFDIGNGSYKFMNWNAVVDPEKIAQGAPDPRKQRTSFNKVISKWTVKDGYFNMREFDLDAPLMAGSGSGGFSPSEETIDLRFKADFAAVPSVTVRIVGHIQDPEIKVPKDKIVTDTLKNIIDIPGKSLRFLRDLFF